MKTTAMPFSTTSLFLWRTCKTFFNMNPNFKRLFTRLFSYTRLSIVFFLLIHHYDQILWTTLGTVWFCKQKHTCWDKNWFIFKLLSWLSWKQTLFLIIKCLSSDIKSVNSIKHLSICVSVRNSSRLREISLSCFANQIFIFKHKDRFASVEVVKIKKGVLF